MILFTWKKSLEHHHRCPKIISPEKSLWYFSELASLRVVCTFGLFSSRIFSRQVSKETFRSSLAYIIYRENILIESKVLSFAVSILSSNKISRMLSLVIVNKLLLNLIIVHSSDCHQRFVANRNLMNKKNRQVCIALFVLKKIIGNTIKTSFFFLSLHFFPFYLL